MIYGYVAAMFLDFEFAGLVLNNEVITVETAKRTGNVFQNNCLMYFCFHNKYLLT